jgi:hypothetical protein
VTGRHSNQLNYRTKTKNFPIVPSTCWTVLKGSAKIALPSISPKFAGNIFRMDTGCQIPDAGHEQFISMI